MVRREFSLRMLYQWFVLCRHLALDSCAEPQECERSSHFLSVEKLSPKVRAVKA
jgi:hypothetical protein